MFNKKALLLVASAFMLMGCTTPAETPSTPAADDGMDYEVNEDVETVPFDMYIIGSHWNSWSESTIYDADPSCKFEKDAETGKLVYTAVVTEDMAGSWVGFKFIATNTWTEQYGAEDIDIENCNQAYKDLIGYTDRAAYEAVNKEGTSNRTNVINTTIDETYVGTYKITYDPINFKSTTNEADTPYSYKFTIEFTAA